MRRIVSLLLVVVVAACSSIAGKPLTLEARPSEATWFVERHSRDERDLAASIAGALQARGVNAVSGRPEQRPESFDVLVTYQDRWNWDMRMYLLDLRIDVQDAKSHELLAYGQSYQDSLAALGKHYQDIVNRVLDQILPKKR